MPHFYIIHKGKKLKRAIKLNFGTSNFYDHAGTIFFSVFGKSNISTADCFPAPMIDVV